MILLISILSGIGAGLITAAVILGGIALGKRLV